MAAQPIDYAALAEQARKAGAAPSGAVDYAALADQARSSGTAQATASDASEGPLDALAHWGERTFPHIGAADAAHSESDALRNPATSGISRFIANTVGTVGRGVTGLPAAAVDSVTQKFDPEQYLEQYLHPVQYEQKRLASHVDTSQPVVGAGDAVPKVTAENVSDVGSDLLGQGILAYGTGKLADGLMRFPTAAKRFVTGNVDVPAAGSTISPRMRYEAAQRLGVNLDAADATGSPLLGNLKRIGENSLAGGHLYDHLKAANTSALQGSTDSFLNGLYDGDRESGGQTIQDALKANHENLRTGAETGFKQLTEQTKGQPVQGAPVVGQAADTLLRHIEPFAAEFPSLAPKKTLHVLNDLSRIGVEPPTPPTSFLDAPGSEFAVPQRIGPAQPTTWADLQRLRSATHDLTTTNPDLVKSQAIAPLQQMTHSLDDAMTNASSGLTPAQAEIFREANAQWKDMKGTYDDPSSPFHHAVRTDNPSTLFSGVGPKTPENAINLRRRLSPFDNNPPANPSPALGAIRRGTVESALKPTNEGAPNFRTFGTQLNRIPADYRAELFSPDQNATLSDIMHTSNVLGKDFNPSGSGKLGQKVAEAAALVPTGGLPLVQYPLAKIMTKPGTVDWLMRRSARPNPFVGPGAAISVLNGNKHQASQ